MPFACAHAIIGLVGMLALLAVLVVLPVLAPVGRVPIAKVQQPPGRLGASVGYRVKVQQRERRAEQRQDHADERHARRSPCL